jgi:hypothetical protein
MHLFQNVETIDRLVLQGELLLKAFHAENEKDPTGHEAEFLRGDLAGWCSTLHTLYGDCAEEIVDRVRTKTCLPIPVGNSSCCRFAPLEGGCPTQGTCRWN